MLNVRRPVGFGTVKQTADFFGIPQAIVKQRAASGDWPNYIIAGRRVFDLDAILDLLANSPSQESQEVGCET